MQPRDTCVFGARLMLAMLLAAFASSAQETNDVESPGPAVDTSAPADAVADERDSLQPAVPAAALAADVSRQESGGQVMDRLELGRTEITGNSELPTVLYIVPWKKSDPGDLMGKPVNTLLDEVLAPIDREEFIRQVDYYGDLYGEDEQN
jgi:hypothetical protein